MVEDLSDKELDSIGQVVKEIKGTRKKVNDFGEKVKNSVDIF